MAILRTQLDGVDALIVPGPGDDGAVRAGISFRVGYADETLARSGASHLIEHLALFQFGSTDAHVNGTTGETVTSFFTAGPVDQAADFLRRVCTALGELPFDRLATEKGILETEAAGRRPDLADLLRRRRYGARSRGLGTSAEWGLNVFTPDYLRAWSARYFTRANAVVWLTGVADPDHLPAIELPLPAGQPCPLPDLAPLPLTTPAWMAGPAQGLAWQTFVPRVDAATAYAQVLGRRLHQVMRQDTGLSYSTQVAYRPIDARYAELTAACDCQPGKAEPAAGAFLGVLAGLRAGQFDQAEVASAWRQPDPLGPEAEQDAADIGQHVFDALIGRQVVGLAERQGRPEPAVAELWEVAARSWDVALLAAPPQVQASIALPRLPGWSTSVVAGPGYTGDSGAVLYLGADGFSLVAPGVRETVRLDDSAALLAWPDGARVLVGVDWARVDIEPNRYPSPVREALSRLDAAVGPDLIVAMPPRDPKDIPAARWRWPRQPKISPGLANLPAPAAVGRRGPSVWHIVGLIVLVLVFLAFAPATVFMATQVGTPADTDDMIVGVVIFGLVAIASAVGVAAIGRVLLRR
ncbi:MAG: hypothetical protein LBR32_10420 [Propionibacteriaceae bacterium]|jgi:hypothetical protein|nr:hypothetical protein [Propionibacteriaceae bacterium]